MKTFKKVVVILGGLIVLLIASLIFIFNWEGSSKDIVSVADQLKVPSSWKLESEMIRPPRMVCLDGGACPEVARTWTVDGQLSTKDLDKILKDSNFSFPIKGDCVLPANVSSNAVHLCDASGTIRDFGINIWLSEDSSTYQQRIIIDVRPER
jgi:hypothetical protein